MKQATASDQQNVSLATIKPLKCVTRAVLTLYIGPWGNNSCCSPTPLTPTFLPNYDQSVQFSWIESDSLTFSLMCGNLNKCQQELQAFVLKQHQVFSICVLLFLPVRSGCFGQTFCTQFLYFFMVLYITKRDN